MSFFAVEPTQDSQQIIQSSAFWPDIDTAKLRATMRLDGTVTDERLIHSTINAVSSVNSELKEWRQGKLTEGYEAKISNLENQNQELSDKVNTVATIDREILKNKFEQREDVIRKQTESRIQAERNSFEAKETKLRQNMAQLQKNYDKKMSTLQSKTNLETKKMSLDFQNKLQEQKNRLTQKIDQNQINFEREMARVEAANESEKSNLIAQYEERIKQLEDISKNKLLEIEEFNRMQKA